MLVAATERGLCVVRFGESVTELEHGLRNEFHAATLLRDDAAMRRYIEPLLASLGGNKTTIDLPLDVRATAFQRKIWEALQRIPLRRNPQLHRHRARGRRSEGSPRRGSRLRFESCGAGGAVSPRRAPRWPPRRISLGY